MSTDTACHFTLMSLNKFIGRLGVTNVPSLQKILEKSPKGTLSYVPAETHLGVRRRTCCTLNKTGRLQVIEQK